VSARVRTWPGYDVQATDGIIGKVDAEDQEPGAGHLVVDSGRWVFHRKVMVPAGIVERVDGADQRIYLDRPRNQIRDAPEYDPDRRTDAGYREQLGSYYADGR
jgi:hypothetical protein